jgi:formate dehydrogenase major subunit
MMNVIIEEGLQDKEYIAVRTENYDELVSVVKNYSPVKVAEICGIDAEELKKAARIYTKADKAASPSPFVLINHDTLPNLSRLDEYYLLCIQ